MHFSTVNLFAALSLTAFSQAAILPRQSDIDQWLDAHNEVRAQHNAEPLTWNNQVAATAQSWADQCTMEHSGGQYGENLAWGGGSFPIPAAVKLWADEVSEYDPNNPQYSHFTQVVWKSTTELGCAVADCSGTTYHVCSYNPPGNVIGQFPENVEV
uniref:Pathogenesis-related protein 1 n=1 Tax=Moniliophthora perniciosa TaxID=153609 RepID=A0A8E6Y896_MONPR|nr:pathogenesis-related protein 1 [Moniliophthora perniciosa]